jgi:hypothetical protein
MNPATQRISRLLMGALFLGVSGLVAAQDTAPAQAAPAQSPAAPAAKPAPKSSAQIDAGEPRANTSGSPTQSAPTSSTAPVTSPNGDSAPAPGATTTAKGRGKGAPGEKPAGAGGTDRLNLGTATVTGDREQPKVMYIVPWKKSDIGDLSGKPMNSLLDEALAPVDRDEFKREVAYFDAVKADTSQNGGTNAAAKQVEK